MLQPSPAATGDRAEWRALFERVEAGEPGALDESYDLAAGRIYALAVWRTGSTADAADVVQETFIRLAQQRGKGRLSTVRDPLAWLLTIAHRIAIDWTRRNRNRRDDTPLDQIPFLEASDQDVERLVEARRLSTAIAELPPAQRVAILLHHFSGCTFAEIGTITGAPTFTAASRYRQGIRKLRKFLGEPS